MEQSQAAAADAHVDATINGGGVDPPTWHQSTPQLSLGTVASSSSSLDDSSESAEVALVQSETSETDRPQIVSPEDSSDEKYDFLESLSSFWSILYLYLMHHRVELCVFLAVTFSFLTTFLQASGLIKGKLQLRRQAPPQRFFSPSSPVLDLFNGSNSAVHELLNNGEFVFVMYYAPWSTRSIDARFHFDRLARSFDGQVQFIAVNCWDPGGNCRKLYKMYNYPVFVLYSTSTFQGIYYHGVISADYMYRFLHNALYPFIRLDHAIDVDHFLLSSHVSAVIANFDFAQNTTLLTYSIFHWTSLKALEQDPLRQQIRFAVLTNPSVAGYFKIMENGHVRFYHWFTSFDNYSIYPKDLPYKSQSLVKWMFEFTVDRLQWYSGGAYSKSEDLQDVFSQPTIVLFTPRMPLLVNDRNFVTFASAAMKYYDCQDSPYVDRTIFMMQRDFANSLKLLTGWKEFCGLDRKLPTDECCRDIVVSRTYASYRNICDICLPPNVELSSPLTTNSAIRENTPISIDGRSCTKFALHAKTLDSFSGSVLMSKRSCDELSQYLRYNKLVEYCCDDQQLPKRAVHLKAGVDDRRLHFDRSEQHCNKSNCKSFVQRSFSPNAECNKLRLARMLRYPLESLELSLDDGKRQKKGADDDSELVPNFRGLSCRTNRTVRFLAIDSDHFRFLAENIGIPNSSVSVSSRNLTALAIVDKSNENVYVMPQNLTITTQNINQFIMNYTFGMVQRHLKSESSSVLDSKDSWTTCVSLDYRICIEKVNSNNFHKIILNRKRDVVLLYTARWCGMCQQVSHVYQSLAFYFRSISREKLTFAQIDASRNDLPWQFTVSEYPTILFFPSNDVNESIAYPSRLPLTLPNLISFVLANCGWRVRLQTSLSMCSNRCFVDNAKAIPQQIRKFERSLARLRVYAKTKSYLWDWVEEDEDFGPMIPSYLSGIWKDIAETQVKIRTLRSLLRFVMKSRTTLTNLNSRSNFEENDALFNAGEVFSLLQSDKLYNSL